MGCILLQSCSNSSDEGIETAKFALDSEDWDGAINATKDILAEDPGNIAAALVLSSAYAGRGGFRLLDLATVVTKDIYRHDLFGATRGALIFFASYGIDDIRLAIDTLLLEAFPEPGIGNIHFSDYNFQAGLLMLIEAYALPTLKAQPVKDGPIDVNAITEEIKEIVEADFIAFDERMENAGADSDNDLIDNPRRSYCALHNASVRDDGIDVEALRDMILCNLSPNDGEGLSRANGDFQSSLIDTCADFRYAECEESPPATEL